MSFLASISNAFKPSTPQGQGNQGGQNQGQGNQGQGNGFSNPQGQGGQPAGGNQNDPNASNGNPNQQVNGSNEPVDPSVLWNKMWDTSKDGEKTTAPPQLNLDPKVLDEVTGKMDFMQGIDPELVQKATNGDSQALIQMMHQVAKNSYRSSLSHAGALTNEFVGQREGFFSKQLPGQIKSHLTENLMADGAGKAPQFVQNQMRDIASKIQKANPDATPAQVQQHVQQYIQELSKFASGNQSGESNDQAQGNQDHQGTDWDKWLNA